jgi:hypothetical protein
MTVVKKGSTFKRKQDTNPQEKGREILQQMREDTSSKHRLDKIAEQATARSVARVKELADLGQEEAFVKQIKQTFPGIGQAELIEKIALFPELKRIRSTGA